MIFSEIKVGPFLVDVIDGHVSYDKEDDFYFLDTYSLRVTVEGYEYDSGDFLDEFVDEFDLALEDEERKHQYYLSGLYDYGR